MIIIGYQGIGKSTLANSCFKYIDLESGCFWVDGKRHDDWYIAYTQMAEHLSKQGYSVFVSSHEVVRNSLVDSDEKVICCVPDISLKDKWIEKLKLRYEKSGLEKDYKAYMNAFDRFSENINEIMSSGFGILKITSIDYGLKELIDSVSNEYGR